MAMRDHSEPVQAAILAVLRADPAVTAIFGQRIIDYVAAGTTKPYIRYGYNIVTPYESSCDVGAETRVTIHTFFAGYGGSKLTAAQRGNATIVAALDGEDEIPLTTGRIISIDVHSVQNLEDGGDQGVYHGVIMLDVVTGEIRD